MRIAIVTTSYPAEPGDPCGHFVQAEARARALTARVTVVTARHDPRQGFAQGHGRQGPEHDLAPGVAPDVHALNGGDAFGWPGVATRVRQEPARLWGAARWMREARQALVRHGPFDRIVAHWALPCAWPVARRLPGDLEIVSHGGDVRALLALPAGVRRALVRGLALSAKEWRFVSDGLMGDLLAALRPAERSMVERVSRVEPCPIELPDVRHAIAQRRADFGGKRLYVCVGRLVESKRVDRVIDHVAGRMEPTTLVVVGDGPLRRGLERHAQRRRVDARFVGKTSRPEALAWMGAADALVHASEKEGLSTVIREAHALGVRVVTLACLAVALVALLSGCTDHAARPSVARAAAASVAAPSAETVGRAAPPAPVPSAAASGVATRDSIHGDAFPDGVLALTWDDGPDEHTLELGRYLHAHHVPATFFVVGEWREGMSSDPGTGARVYETGTHALPILGELIALGHRIANHTENHVLLDRAPASVVTDQLARDQREIAPFQTGGMRFFRAPGGAWNGAASAAVDGDPALSALVGPIGWDFDERDWDGSLSCTSADPRADCEPKAPLGAPRVRPEVMAARYAVDIERHRRGIVLLHDRVGHVGSRYALDLARVLVPRLIADGFVFAAPVLGFGPAEARTDVARDDAGWVAAGEPLVGDLNGDGRPDRCARRADGIACSLARGEGFALESPWLTWSSAPTAFASAARLRLADVSHDGRADLCAEEPNGAVRCALAP